MERRGAMLEAEKSAAPGGRRVKIFGERLTGTTAAGELLMRCAGLEIAPGVATRFDPTITRRIEAGKPFWSLVPERFWIERQVDLCFEGRRPREAWKHARPSFDQDFVGLPVLFMVRHPLSWLARFYDFSYHRLSPIRGTFHAFATRPWRTVRRENMPPVVPNPLVLWNEKLAAYRSFAEQAARAGSPVAFARQEDLVLRQMKTVVEICEGLGFDSDAVRAIGRPGLRLSPKPDDDRGLVDIAASTRAETWRDAYDRATFEAACARVDWDLAALFDYAPGDPPDATTRAGAPM